MNPIWQGFLERRGARIAGGRVEGFGDSVGELRAARDSAVLCDLSHFGLLRCSGDDGEAFLQSQLTGDVQQISLERAQYSSLCTPKGRMLASLLVWRTPEGFFLQLPAELADDIRRHLAKYVLRSKVKIADAEGDFVRFGVAGPGAQEALAEVVGDPPPGAFDVRLHGNTVVVRLPLDRFEIAALPGEAAGLWERLERRAAAAGAPAWDWLEVRAGVPVVLPATREEFVPQMANLDLIGGVSFKKGCYPGQEIVARTHYLGRLKRRLYLAHLEGSDAPTPGDLLFSADAAGQSSGTVANVAPSPDGGFDLLAVVQISSAESEVVCWKALDGPPLRFLPLPYSV